MVLTSCVDEPVDISLLSVKTGETNSTYYLKETKVGVEKKFSSILAINATVLNSFLITASDSSVSMTLNLRDISKPGVYNLSWAEVSCVYTEGIEIYSSDYSGFNTSAGNITVTEINATNKTIKGTFNFIGKNQNLTATKVFTKGEFFVQYTL